MRATHLLLGCVLCFGVSATAVAANTSAAHSTDSTACPTPDGGSNHGGNHDGSASGDAVSVSHSTAASVHTAHSSSSADEGSIRIGADGGGASDSSRSSNLGWQSLLPGSIQ